MWRDCKPRILSHISFALFIFLITPWFGHAMIKFTPAHLLNTNANTSNGNAGGIRIALGESNVWIAVWSAPGARPVMPVRDYNSDAKNQDIFFARSMDNGNTWSPAALLKTNASSDDGDDIEPDIATDGKGKWVVTWRSMDSLGSTLPAICNLLVTHSADNGVSWSAPNPLNTDASTNNYGDQIRPAIATDGQGNWTAFWSIVSHVQDINGSWYSAVKTAWSNDNGAHWSAPTVIEDTYNYADCMPSLTADGKGRWIACWNIIKTKTEGAHDWTIMFSKSDDSGHHWTVPASLSNRAGTNVGTTYQAPFLITDKNGSWLAAWNSNDTLNGTIGSDNDILCSRSTDNGETWAPATPLNTNATTDAESDIGVQLAYDPSGYCLAVWTSTDSLSGTIGTDTDQLYSVSRDMGQTWTLPLPVNNYAATDNAIDGLGDGSFHSSALATDKQGHFIVAWDSNETSAGTTGSVLNVMCASGSIQPITLLSPHGGEQWPGGSAISVHWNTDDMVQSGPAIRIELWKGQTKVTNLDSDYIPNIGNNTSGEKTSLIYLPLVPTGTDYHLRLISLLNSTIYDENTTPFSVTSPLLQIKYPHGNILWPIKSYQMVWLESKLEDVGNQVILELYRDGVKVSDLTVIDKNATDKWVWVRVPEVPVNMGYTIRATSLTNSSIIGYSIGFIQVGPADPSLNSEVKVDHWNLYTR